MRDNKLFRSFVFTRFPNLVSTLARIHKKKPLNLGTANTNTFIVFKYFYATILNQRIHSNYNLQTLFSVYYHGDQAIFVTIIYIIMYLQIGNLPRNNNN